MKNKVYWPYILAAYGSLFCFGLLDNIRAPFFFDLTEDLHLNDSQASLYFAITSFFAFVGSQSVERFVDRIAPKWGLLAGVGLLFSGVFLNSRTTSFSGLMTFSAVHGLGMGLVMVFQHVCVQEGSTELSRRRLMSGLHSMYAFSSLLGPLLAGVLISQNKDWRQAYVYASLFPLLVFFLQLWMKGVVPDQTSHQKRLTSESSQKFLLMLYTSCIVGFYGVSELTISTRLPLFIRRVQEVSGQQAAWYLSLFFTLLLVGRLTFTFFAFRRWTSAEIMKWSLSLSLVFNILGLLHNPLWLAICGLTMAPFFGVAMDFLAEVFVDKAASAITYAVSTMSILVVPCHYLIGVLAEMYNMHVGMSLGACSLFLSTLLMWCFPVVQKLLLNKSDIIRGV